MRIKIFCGIIIATFMSACVAPKYTEPAPPKTTAYTVGDELVTEQQHIALGKQIESDWWSLFANEELNRVIQQAIKDNYNIEIARRNLAQAEEAVKSKRGALWPQVGLQAIVSNQLYGKAFFGPSTISIPAFTSYQLGPAINWNLDFFGATRYAIEQKKAFALYQVYNLDAVYLLLTSNVANQALEIASAKAEIACMQRIIEEDQKTLDLIKTKFAVGSATRLDIFEAQNRVDSDQAQLPALRQRISVAKHALAILVGKAPADWQQPDFEFADFTLPQELPLSLPSELVHKRPDIMAAEANLQAAHAAVGVATANLYPSIVISGSLMQEALNLRTLFDGVNTAWSLAANLTQPLFQGGTLRAEKRKAEHAYKAALAEYKQTILSAFKEVADTLSALKNDADAIKVWQQSVDVASETLTLAQESYAAGATNLLQLQTSQRDLERAQINLILAKKQQYVDTAHLFIAMGGSPLAGTSNIDQDCCLLCGGEV